MLRGGGSDERQYECRTGRDIGIIGREPFVIQCSSGAGKAAPERIIRYLTGHAAALFILRLIPLHMRVAFTDLKLDRGIMLQVIEPDERVMDLAVIRLQRDMPVIEGEGRVDNDDVIRYLR